MDNIPEKEIVTVNVTEKSSILIITTPKGLKYIKINKAKFKLAQENDSEFVFQITEVPNGGK